MYERYAELRDYKGVKDSEVARATGIAPATFSDWKQGKYTPKNDKLLKLAEYFGVSLSYLTGAAVEEEKDSELLSVALSDPNLRALMFQGIEAPPEAVLMAIAMMKSYTEMKNSKQIGD